MQTRRHGAIRFRPDCHEKQDHVEERKVEEDSINSGWKSQVVAVERKMLLVAADERVADERSIEKSLKKIYHPVNNCNVPLLDSVGKEKDRNRGINEQGKNIHESRPGRCFYRS